MKRPAPDILCHLHHTAPSLVLCSDILSRISAAVHSIPTMAHSHTVASKTIAAVERARQEVNSFKAQVAKLVRPDAPGEAASVGRGLLKHITQAEALVEKVETTVKRLKAVGRVPPRPTASIPASVRAKRALSVLSAGLGMEKGTTVMPNSKDPSTEAESRNVRRKLSGPVFLSAAGKPVATPLREDDFASTLQIVAKSSPMGVGRIGTRGVGFECRNVFRAFVYFKEVDPPANMPAPASKTYIVPEHISCFGIDETNASRWSCSKYAVFNVLTERANAAIRYFMAREETGEAAFMALAEWLAKHNTLFVDRSEDGRFSAFDTSRGIFLPACIHSFDGSGQARFTRGFIPLRSNSAQPTVRIPPNSQGQAPAQAPSSINPNSVSGSTAPSSLQGELNRQDSNRSRG